jgi:hypothetical protein
MRSLATPTDLLESGKFTNVNQQPAGAPEHHYSTDPGSTHLGKVWIDGLRVWNW